MSENDGNLKADIPADAIEAALRSVERPSSAQDEASEGSSDEVKRLKAMLEESTSRAAQTAERLKETHERYVRVAADFENWKKRSAKEREETVKFANERILKDMFLVIDNLERALAAPESANLKDGVKLVLKQFGDTLGRYGVKSFSAVGEPFDPSRHEALMQMESETAPANVVISEMAKGYLLNDRLARPAQVVVSKGPPASATPPAGQEDRKDGAPGELLN